MKTTVLYFLLLTLTMSCKNSIQNIYVEGVVLDSQSGASLTDAHVTILCWKPSGFKSDDIDYKTAELTTNENGKFSTTFQKGVKLDVAAKKTGYQVAFSRIDKVTDSVYVILRIERDDIESTEQDRAAISDDLYLSVKEYSFENVKKTVLTGINIRLGTNTELMEQMDVWAEKEKSETYPSMLRTHGDGGLIPIFEEEIKQTILFEKNTAPISGYVSSYKLQGNEVGFFVRSKNGTSYAKLILKQARDDISGPSKNGTFKEFRLNFKLIHQPSESRNLFVNSDDIDLEQFLLESK